MIRRTRVEVDLSAIVENAKLLRRLITPAEVIAVVKADGYGHGAATVAKTLAASKVASGFAVSLVEEGVALRQSGVQGQILVLGPSQVAGEDEIVAHGLTPVIGGDEDVDALVAVARRRGVTIDAHLKVDTGMGRLGVQIARAPEIAVVAARNGVRIVGAMTHFACADSDDPDDPASMTRAQLARFDEACATLVKAGAPITTRHTANSSGALFFPEARLDVVRSGIAIYGNGRWPAGSTPRQAMRLVTEVAQLRSVEVGASIGYGALWKATRPSRVAVLPVGYADGLPRRATGHAEVAIRGKRAPLVGLVSMDIAIADVTDIPGVTVGDAAVLLGRASDGASISTAEYAAWCGLSEYEVTCGMSKRVPRTYMGELA